MEVGIDIEKIERFKLDRNDSFLKLAFSENELNHSFMQKMPEIELCRMFCIKEAVMKTLSQQDLLLKNIEVKLPLHENIELNTLEDLKSKFIIKTMETDKITLATAIRMEAE